MPISNWTKVTVRYNFGATDDSSVAGAVTFTPEVTDSRFIDAALTTIVYGRTVSGTLSSTGTGSVALYANDDPDLTPTGWTYKVVEPSGYSYSISVPISAATAGIDLANLAPTGSSAGTGSTSSTAYLTTSQRESPTGVAGLTAAGKLFEVRIPDRLADTALAEAARDTIAAALVAGTNVTITPNDAADTITIAATGGGTTGTTDPEVVRDTMAAALVAGANVTITPNDAADTITIAATSGGTGSTVTNPRLGILRVASSLAPATVRAQCDYECSGTNDQVQINNALQAASRPVDGFGGIGAGCVELVGGDFFTSHNGIGSITMYPATWLRGSGPGVAIQSRWPTNVDRGVIELVNSTTDHVRISDLTIGRPNEIASNGHAIKLSQQGSGNFYELDTGNDSFCMIEHVLILKMAGKGIWITGTGAGNARETQVVDCHIWNTTGTCFDIDSSDSKFTSCSAQAGAGGPGFNIAGGNTKLSNCKSWYSEVGTDGFLISSTRAELNGCAAQDNGRWGFNVNSTDATLVGCVADSNARLTTLGGGFQISSGGVFQGLHCFDRAQTPASPQLRGIVFVGSPDVLLSGRVSVPSGTAHIVGTPGANSHVRVVRAGSTLYSVG